MLKPNPKTHDQFSLPTSAIVFIAGCGRSGTTYLRTIVDAHPDIFIPSESLFLIDYLKYAANVPKRVLSWLFFNEPQLKAWYRGRPFRISNIQHAICHVHEHDAFRNGARIWGQKTPRFIRHMGLFNLYFQNIKWILIYRDPRAVVASMLQSKRHTYAVSSACRRWLKDNRPIIQILKARNSSDNILIVKYEDLIENTEESVANVFDFLGVPPVRTESLPRSARSPKLKGTRFVPNAVRNGLTPQMNRINAWSQVLSRQQIQYIETKCAREMRFFGYTPFPAHNSSRAVPGAYISFDWAKDLLIVNEYLRKWPQYLFHVFCRKVFLIMCDVIKRLPG